MNVIFFALIAIAFVVTGFHQLTWVAPAPEAVSPMFALGNGMIESAKGAVTLALGLVGVMAFCWCGCSPTCRPTTRRWVR